MCSQEVLFVEVQKLYHRPVSSSEMYLVAVDCCCSRCCSGRGSWSLEGRLRGYLTQGFSLLVQWTALRRPQRDLYVVARTVVRSTGDCRVCMNGRCTAAPVVSSVVGVAVVDLGCCCRGRSARGCSGSHGCRNCGWNCDPRGCRGVHSGRTAFVTVIAGRRCDHR